MSTVRSSVSRRIKPRSGPQRAHRTPRSLRPPRTQETSLERIFRYALTRAGIPFEQNVPLGLAQPDFLLRKSRVVIEVDGAFWHSSQKQKRRDIMKDRYYRGMGLHVYRFTEEQVTKDADGCIRKLLIGGVRC